MYEWSNAYLIAEGLEEEAPPAKTAVLDALDRILELPFEPEGVPWHHMLPTGSRREQWVGFLPFGYVLVYRPYKNGPPPLAGGHVCVLGFRHYDLLDSRSATGPHR